MKKAVDATLNEYGREVNFGKGFIEMNGERIENWKQVWTKLKALVKLGAQEKRKESFKEKHFLFSFREKKMQNEITLKFMKEDYGWLECNTDPRKMAGIFDMHEPMVETRF